MYNHAAGILFDLDEVTDLVESSMLSHRSDHISIYSNSWGPSDSGFAVGGPGKYTAAVLQQGAAEVGHLLTPSCLIRTQWNAHLMH